MTAMRSIKELLSPVAISCLHTMGLTAPHDDRQNIPGVAGIPPEPVRLLRAKLILEEALETVAALGFNVMVPVGPGGTNVGIQDADIALVRRSGWSPGLAQLEDIIDGCCDTVYVAIGTLVACGVPDVPHLAEVCRANEAKFPGGQVIVNDTGKFQKPFGWRPPDHTGVYVEYAEDVDLTAYQNEILAAVRNTA